MTRLQRIASFSLSLMCISCGGGGSAEAPEFAYSETSRDSNAPINRASVSEYACPLGVFGGADSIEAAEFLGRPAERITYLIEEGAKSVVYRINNGRETVLYHSGHGGHINNTLIDRLLDANFTVVVFQMPLVNENSGPWGSHDNMDSLCPFVSPVIRYLNDYGPAHMVGFSGGGWTTILAAAMDDRVEKSIAISASLPYDQRKVEDYGDFEQRELNRFADYRDIYALASYQVAIQNRYDSCCFAGTALMELEIPGWHAVLDESHNQHIISDYAIEIVLGELTTSFVP